MSSSDIAVSVRGLSKSYTIAHNAEKHTTAGEALVHRLKHPFQKPDKETFWALKDVEFDIKKGDVVGIIGRNGAGKSTLLKILSRITEPTTGQIDLYGRVGSLLEVGTGFHPELTGRENIFLNGAILGMSKREIAKQFDEIVDFSGTEQFIDTPVKRYSSGMYVRLAFAVAAHLNPEILIVDEVLAVGDAEFQKKCLGKMQDVACTGKTVIFVSHNLQSVKMLCNQCLYLEKGNLLLACDTKAALEYYMTGRNTTSSEYIWEYPSEDSNYEVLKMLSVRACDKKGRTIENFSSEKPIFVELEFELYEQHSSLCVGFDLVTTDGVCVFRSFHTDVDDELRPVLEVGRNKLLCIVPAGFLNAGGYAVSLRIGIHHVKWLVVEDELIRFDVVFDHGKSRFLKSGERPGCVAPLLAWTNNLI